MLHFVAFLVAFLLTLAGALAVYLASPNQRLRPTPVARAGLAWLGLALVVAGGVLWRVAAGFSLTAVIFVVLTVAMLVWVALPYGDAGLGLLRARRLQRRPDRS